MTGKLQALNQGELRLSGDYKILASSSDYGNFVFEIWHRKEIKPKKKGIELLKSLLASAKVDKLKTSTKGLSLNDEKWKKMTITTKAEYTIHQDNQIARKFYKGDARLNELIDKYPTIETKGIHFYLSRKSVEFDFYVKITVTNSYRDYIYRGKKRQGLDTTAIMTIKYNNEEPNLKLLEAQSDKIDYITKMIEKSSTRDAKSKPTKNGKKKRSQLEETQ